MTFLKILDFLVVTTLVVFAFFSLQGVVSAHEENVNQENSLGRESQNESIPVEEILIEDDDDFYEEMGENTTNNTNQAPINNGDIVRFYLYTRDNPSSEFRIIIGDKERLRRSPFKPSLPVKILIHGFGGNTSHRYPSALKDAFLKTNKNVNVILVDWSVLAASPFYDRAVYNTVAAGKETAKLVVFLISADTSSLDKIHIIGHSLGAHVAGIAGSQVDFTLGHKIPRITGLDPARPAFEIASRKRSLDDSDANFVDVIHTSLLGLYRVVGHVDFYPNKGLFQPGCLHFDLSCSHSRSHEMFTKALYFPRGTRGCRCPMNKNMVGQIPRIIPRRCVCHDRDETSVAFMGNMHDKKRGVFYFETGQREKAQEEDENMF